MRCVFADTTYIKKISKNGGILMFEHILIALISYILGIVSLYCYKKNIKIREQKNSYLLKKQNFLKNFNHGKEFSNKDKNEF